MPNVGLHFSAQMKESIYQEIVALLNESPGVFRDVHLYTPREAFSHHAQKEDVSKHLRYLQGVQSRITEKYPEQLVSTSTLRSIESTLVKIEVFSKTNQIRKAIEKRDLKMYHSNVNLTLLDLAAALHFSPALYARWFVQHSQNLSKKSVAKLMRDPLKHIKDERLRRDVVECIGRSRFFSPVNDRIRGSKGREFEKLLERQLDFAGIAYETEDDLRKKGFAKTPDIHLKAPIALRDKRNKLRIVKWIDSKAMFGDRQTHMHDNKKQFMGYLNRFGPGLVIYHFDFVEELNDEWKDVFCVQTFPSSSFISF